MGFVPVRALGFGLGLGLGLGPIARADDLDGAGDDRGHPPPTWHASAGLGASLLFTGAGGDGTRFDGALAFQFRGSRFGVLAAARAFDDEPRDVVLTAGVEYQAAASRPRVVLTLYADAGIETAGSNPVLGAGTRTVFRVIGPVALIGDTGFHLVVDGLDGTALVIGSALMLGVAR